MRYALAFILFAICGPACAQSAMTTADAVLTDLEKRVVAEYYKVKTAAIGGSTATDQPAATKGSGKTQRGRPQDVGEQKAKGQGKGKDMPPGLAKKDQLPPGLAKRDKLPPGLQRDQLPTDLNAKLPPAKPGTDRVLVGGDLVLIDRATSVVLDILKNVRVQ